MGIVKTKEQTWTRNTLKEQNNLNPYKRDQLLNKRDHFQNTVTNSKTAIFEAVKTFELISQILFN